MGKNQAQEKSISYHGYYESYFQGINDRKVSYAALGGSDRTTKRYLLMGWDVDGNSVIQIFCKNGSCFPA